MLTYEDTGMVVLSNDCVRECSHVLDTDIGFRGEFDPDRTHIGGLTGRRCVLFQHLLGGVCFESHVFAPGRGG